MSTDLNLTLFESSHPNVLTKTFSLVDGALQKRYAANMLEGTSRTVQCDTLEGFASLLESLTSAQALSYGTAPDHPTARVQSDKARDSGSISRTREFFQFAALPGIMMLDHDGTATGDSISADELRSILIAAAPVLEGAAMLWRPSASSCISDALSDAQYTGINGQRIYIAVEDASLIPLAGKALFQRLWAAGHGWVQVGGAGQMLLRSLIDASVWQPERLDFAGPPVLTGDLRRQLPAPRFWGDPANKFDLSRLMTDAGIARAAQRQMQLAKVQMAPASHAARAEWVEANAPDMATREGIDIDSARDRLTNASASRSLCPEFLLTASGGETVTVASLLAEPLKWHGKRFADPLEPAYGQDDRIAYANLTSGSAPFIWSHAHGGVRYSLAVVKPRIMVAKGQKARVVDQTLDVIRQRGQVFDFGEGGSMARIAGKAAIPVSKEWLADYLERTCHYFGIKKDGEEYTADAPPHVSQSILAKAGERDLQRLDAIVTAPTLRRDGSVLDEPGYDAESRLLYLGDAGESLRVPRTPTAEDAVAALRRLWQPFHLFPFVDDVDRGVMLASLVTAVLRGSLPTAPGFAFDAPAAGSGKTLLARALGILATGQEPSISSPSLDEAEMRKRLFASLREGARVIVWDNLRASLGGASIDSFLTAPSFSDRVLGVSETATLPNRALFVATGNNIRLLGDTCRRVLLSRIDSKSEQPYAREFGFDPAAVVAAQRIRFVIDCLTIVRAYIAAGKPRMGKGRFASFEDWDDLVRQPVLWVGTQAATRAEGLTFGDPLAVIERQFDDDPEMQKLAAFMSAWTRKFAGNPTTVQAAINAAPFMDGDEESAELRDALMDIAGQNGRINSRMLGSWIARNRLRRWNGQHIEKGKMLRGHIRWVVAGRTGAADDGSGVPSGVEMVACGGSVVGQQSSTASPRTFSDQSSDPLLD